MVMDKSVENFKILSVYAHPADICCEGSGTIALHAQRGDHITALLLSDGERHHCDLVYQEGLKPVDQQDSKIINADVDQIRAFKRREAERMCDIIGIHELIALGLPDIHWTVDYDMITRVANVIRQVKPDVILTHMPKQNELSHQNIHSLVGQIVNLAMNHSMTSLPQLDGHEPHHTKLIYYFPDTGWTDATENFAPGIVCDVWVDITSVVATKIKAIDQCVSQGYQSGCARKLIESREGRWGMLCGCSYAEAWMRDRAPRYSHLPVRSEDLNEQFRPGGIAGELVNAHTVPSAIPADAYDFPGPLAGKIGSIK